MNIIRFNISIKKFYVVSIIVVLFFCIFSMNISGVSISQSSQILSEYNFNNNDAAPDVEWELTFGDENRDYGMDLLITEDNGFIIAGNYNEGNQGWIFKTDNEGGIVWDRKYGDTNLSHFRNIIKTDDGYIAGGTAYPETVDAHNLWVVKITESGETIWDYTYGEDREYEIFFDLTTSSNGGFLLMGCKGALSDGVYFVKIREDGTEEWNKTYDPNPEDYTDYPYLYDIDESSDGGYICTGFLQQENTGNEDIWLVKMDINGDIVWQKTFDSGDILDRSYSVYETLDGYIIAGDRYSMIYESDDIWVIKTDKNGEEIWNKTYPGNKNNAHSFYIEQLEDNSIIIAGDIGPSTRSDLWVIKIDETGSLLWDKQLGEINKLDDGLCIKKTEDNGYIILGSKEISYLNQDAWLIKLEPEKYDYKPDRPDGPNMGTSNTLYEYTTKAEHPRGNDIQYGWDWDGDEKVDEWTDFYPSGETVNTSHEWESDGIKYVRVIARESNQLTSKWSEPLSVNIPKAKNVNKLFFSILLEKIIERSGILKYLIEKILSNVD